MATLPIIALLIVQINFGILPVAQKYILQAVSPDQLFILRVTGATVIFSSLYWGKRYLGANNTSRKILPLSTHLRIMLFALIGVSLNQFLLIQGLTYTGATSAAVIVPSITLFTYLFALVFRTEKFDPKKAATLALGSMGVMILIAGSLKDFIVFSDENQLLGIVYCVLSAACYALYLVTSKPYTRMIHPLQFAMLLFFYGCLWAILGLSIINNQNTTSLEITSLFSFLMPHQPLKDHFLIILAFIILGPTMIAYMLNIWALRHLTASTVSGFICLQTLFGVMGAKLWLSEALSPLHIAASIFIVSSILILTRSENTPKDTEPTA